MKTTTKLGFDVLQFVDIPRDYLRPRVLRELQGREVFVDTDECIDEKFYYASVFSDIASEQAQMGSGIIALSDEDLLQIDSLSIDIRDVQYVRIIN
jgi:hypothetical protein